MKNEHYDKYKKIQIKIILMQTQFNNEEPDYVNPNKIYMCSPLTKSYNFTFLMKLVLIPDYYTTTDFELAIKTSNVNAQNKIGWTALMMACRNSNTVSSNNVVKLLLDSKADPNITSNWTPLMLSSKYSNSESNIETIKLLLKYNANINTQSEDGCTALILASKYSNSTSNIETIKLLLENGANVNLQDKNGLTALMHVYESVTKDHKIIELLLKYTTDIDIKNNKGHTILMHICNNSKYIKYYKIKTLLESGANINFQNNNGNTSLMYACSNSMITREIIKLLLDNNANINAQDKNGKTALMCACSNPIITCEIIKLLLDNNANINAQDKNGKTALMYMGNTVMKYDKVKLLLEHNADPNLQDIKEKNILIRIIKNHKKINQQQNLIKIIQLLLDYNVNVNIEDDMGQNSLIESLYLEYNRYDIIQLLLKNGADPNTFSKQQWVEMVELHDFLNENPNVQENKKITDLINSYMDLEQISKINDYAFYNHIAEQNFELLMNLKSPQKFKIDGNKLELDERWLQCVNRYLTGNSRHDLINPLKFTFDNLINQKNKQEVITCINSTKKIMTIMYPSFDDLHNLLDNYLLQLA